MPDTTFIPAPWREAPYSKPPLAPAPKLVIVSNREPYSIKRHQRTLKVEKTMGGLVSALDPVMRENQGLWICSNGSPAQDTIDFQDLQKLAQAHNLELPYRLHGVFLSEKELDHYYNGYANRQLWPNFHYFPGRYHYTPTDWRHYFSANQKFAQAVLQQADPEDLIWVHDYHLLLVPSMIRQSDPKRNIAFFCHIPFPHYEIFRILPARLELLRGMLGSDLIGFHTPAYAQDFLDCVARLLPQETEVHPDTGEILYQDRRIHVDAFPISIDYSTLVQSAEDQTRQGQIAHLRQSFPADYIGIGVDRLDYTKGILERLEALDTFFETYPHYRKRLTFVQIAVPTRTQIKDYQEMCEAVEQAVGRINGKWSDGSWSPIQYLYRSLPFQQLIQYYAMADFALVTPLRDGLNLVAKEYCAAQLNHGGALILSELAGAAHQMEQAYLVNPYNRDEVAHTLDRVLQTPSEERQHRMKALRQQIKQHDIQFWLHRFLQDFEKTLRHRDAP